MKTMTLQFTETKQNPFLSQQNNIVIYPMHNLIDNGLQTLKVHYEGPKHSPTQHNKNNQTTILNASQHK